MAFGQRARATRLHPSGCSERRYIVEESSSRGFLVAPFPTSSRAIRREPGSPSRPSGRGFWWAGGSATLVADPERRQRKVSQLRRPGGWAAHQTVSTHQKAPMMTVPADARFRGGSEWTGGTDASPPAFTESGHSGAKCPEPGERAVFTAYRRTVHDERRAAAQSGLAARLPLVRAQWPQGAAVPPRRARSSRTLDVGHSLCSSSSSAPAAGSAPRLHAIARPFRKLQASGHRCVVAQSAGITKRVWEASARRKCRGHDHTR
jgi:hypothetical protein